MSLVMEDHGFQNHRRRSGTRVSTKSKAPSPPKLKSLDPPGFSQWCPGHFHLSMDQTENLIDKEFSLAVVLPGGVEKITTVHGSKPLMDLLVTLCAKYHLNPSSYTLEPVTANRNHIKFKPNTLIGTLEAEKIILKPKGREDEGKKMPRMPEATVRMLINYKNTQKTILRVNPRAPLAELLPAICEKCEFDVETTVLQRDIQSLSPLDLSCSLNDYAIREIYARDTKGPPTTFVFPTSPTYAGETMSRKGQFQREQENKRIFGVFRKSKKKSEQGGTASAPASPVLVSKPRPLSMALPSTNSSPLHSPTMSSEVPKKRRAPQPPVLVSQSGPLDLSTRRRLHSEPTAQLDRDQVSRLSRGSPTGSSLKKSKRRAPPPPTSPSPSHENIPLDENSDVGTAPNTLEEIMEKEETSACAIAATACETQGADNKLETSAEGDVLSDTASEDVNSPSADTETQNSRPMDDSGEDQSCDLSSDGNQMRSIDDSVVCKDQTTTTETAASEVVDTGSGPCQDDNVFGESGPCQDENVCLPSVCEEFSVESVLDESRAESSSPPLPPPPEMQNAETQASTQACVDVPGEETGRLESPAHTSMSRPISEDAQVQTDFTPLPVPSQQHGDEVPPSTHAPVFDSAEKRDMTTSTEELNPADLKPASPHASETSNSTPSPAVATVAPPDYRPKPSNELTRDYIPKVGMTTYTIVPQKYMEKLRYYEVEVTLESPSEAPEKGIDIGSHQSEDCTIPRGPSELASEREEVDSNLPREDNEMSKTTTLQSTVNGSTAESPQSPSAPTTPPGAVDKLPTTDNGASQAVSPAEVKEMKIPPATKPKPGSFRFAQHKRTSGYYVTSAAEKNLSATATSGQREAQAGPGRETLPPPPPAPCPEDSTEASRAELSSAERDRRNTSFMPLTRHCSLPTKEPRSGLSLEKLRSFAAPRPYSPATPSRFAQAVSSAVKRSHSYEPKSPQSPLSPLSSPFAGRSTIPNLERLSKCETSDYTKLDGGEASAPQGGVAELSIAEVAQEEEGNP